MLPVTFSNIMLLAGLRHLGYSRIMFNTGIMKKEILNKIKKAKTIYIWNGFTEIYWKISKTEFLYEFRARCKRQKDHPEHIDSMLEEFNDNINMKDDLILYFN
jgi:hypothetical protein